MSKKEELNASTVIPINDPFKNVRQGYVIIDDDSDNDEDKEYLDRNNQLNRDTNVACKICGKSKIVLKFVMKISFVNL